MNLVGAMNDVTYANDDYGSTCQASGWCWIRSSSTWTRDTSDDLSFAPGITFRDIEVAESCSDRARHLTVNDTLRTDAVNAGSGRPRGGNTSSATGDTIIVTRQARPQDSALLGHATRPGRQPIGPVRIKS